MQRPFGSRRHLLALLLLAVLLVELIRPGVWAAATPTGTTPTRDAWYRANEEAGLELVVAAYDVLQDRFFRPLDSRQLLGAAWDGARKSLAQQRRPSDGVDAPELLGDRVADLARFSESYRSLLTRAGRDVDGAAVAMAAADAMAASVGEQHDLKCLLERGSVGLAHRDRVSARGFKADRDGRSASAS